MFIFLLSTSTGQDKVEILLEQSGISSTNTEQFKELYTQRYYEEGLHLPTFYFSIVPSHYPNTTNDTPDPILRSWKKNLLSNGVREENLKFYIGTVNQLVIDQKLDDIPYLSLSPVELQEELSRRDIGIPTAIIDVTVDQVDIPTPSFRWHGSECQFHRWFNGLWQGEWGRSYTDGRSVLSKVLSALKVTGGLLFANLCLLLIIGYPLILLLHYRSRWWFAVVENLSLVIYLIPLFWLATLVQVFLTSPEYGIKIFNPIQDDYSSPSFWKSIQLAISRYFPALLCLLIVDLALLIRIMKSNIEKEKLKLYPVSAVAKGLTPFQVLTKHLLPNITLPLITLIISSIPGFLAGSLIIEIIFNIPGMGRLLFQSITKADWSVVYGVVLIIGCITIIVFALGDMIYAYFNPKIKYA